MTKKQDELRILSTERTEKMIGANNEITLDRERKTLVYHDGKTRGGFPIGRVSETVQVVEDLAALKALGSVPGKLKDGYRFTFYRSGYGQLMARWDASSTATDNDVNVFQATGVATGRFIVRDLRQVPDLTARDAIDTDFIDSGYTVYVIDNGEFKWDGADWVRPDFEGSLISSVDTLVKLKTRPFSEGAFARLSERENSLWEAVAPGGAGTPDEYGVIEGNGVDWVLAETLPYKLEWFGYERGVRSSENSAAAQACIDAMPATGGSLQYIDGGIYPLSITLYKPCTIFGRGTVIPEALGGYAYTTDPNHTDAVLNREGHLYAINFANHLVQADFDSVVNNGPIADRTTVRDNGAFSLNKLDHFFIDEVTVEHVRREVIDFVTSCREANINIRTRWCGDATRSYPVFRIDETDNTNDAHNNIRFNDSYVIFSLGSAFYFDTNTSGEGRTATDIVRNIFLNNTMVHGIVSQIDGAPYTLVDAHKRALMVDVNDAELIHFTNKTRLHVGGFDAPTVSFKAGSTSSRSRRHCVTDCIISNHYSETSGTYSSPTAGLFPAIKVSGVVDVTVNDNVFLGHNKLIDAASGATVYYGMGNNNENSVDPDTSVGVWIQTGYGKYVADEYESNALNVVSGALPTRVGGDPMTIAFAANSPRMFIENVGWTYMMSGIRNGTGSPVAGGISPRYVLEVYRDTTASPPDFYVAYGTAAGEWKQFA